MKPSVLAAGLALAMLALCGSGPAAAQVTAALTAPHGSEAIFGARECAVPQRIGRLEGELPHTGEALLKGGEVRIVALGSSSTEGIGATSSENSYPARLQTELTRRFPNSTIRVLNKGVGGELASDMVARMTRDAIDLHPTLVIWQTGTNDVERGIDPEAFAATFREGVSLLAKAGIDVLILGPQYTPRVVDRGGYPVYFDLISSLAKSQGAALFRRQAVMRQWVDSGEFTFASMLSADKFHMNDRSYGCLAAVLADSITWAIRH